MAMRRLISCAAAAICACAHANKVPDGAPVFLELESAHYVLFTDLREADARETIGRLENVRGALIQGSWHGDLSPSEKLRVVELASSTELHEFASSAMTAFYQPIDLFGEPMLVMSTDQGPAENVVLKHELAHARHGSFLPRSRGGSSRGSLATWRRCGTTRPRTSTSSASRTPTGSTSSSSIRRRISGARCRPPPGKRC